jgi:shikimate dehydrogenase
MGFLRISRHLLKHMNHRPFVLAGLMGWPVSHSRSPDIHNHWIAEHGLRGSYVLLPVDPANLAQALRALPVLGFAGCNLTIPHKVAAMSLVDRVDPVAQRIGAINTVVVQADGALAGLNTDAYGFLHSLMAEAPQWSPDDGPVAVIGAGGAARAVVVALADKGVREIRVCNRSPDKAIALADEFGPVVLSVPWAQRNEALEGAALLVNTTSQGMGSQPPLDLSLETLPLRAVVSDLVYVPLQTPLLRTAMARGHHTVGGLGMLLHQARPAFESWFGVMPQVTPALRAQVEKSL